MMIGKTTTWVCAVLGASALFACGSDASTAAAEGAGTAGAAQSSAGSSASGAGASSSAGGAGGTAGTNAMGSAGAPSSAGGSAGAPGSSGGAGVANGGSAGNGNALCSGNATYKVTVDVSWKPDLSGAHYTVVIGGVHSAAVSLWKLGGLATTGVKEMAEMGGTSTLASEVNAAVAAHTAKAVVQFGGGNAPGKSSSMLEVTPEFPLVSFGSMLAPSPDWFVGVSGTSLCESGAWSALKSLPAVVYDAGTKDGSDFDYGFPETAPPAAIGYSVKFPSMATAGSITFEKQ